MDRSGDTIFAVASGHGRAAICVVRISGPDAAAVLGEALPAARRPALRAIRDPISGEVLDRTLVLWMPHPATATGEDVLELHLHGGLAVRAAVMRSLAGRPGFRPAEPGEFTRRAFLSGRLDLGEVEGLADLVNAETDAQRREALRQLDGVLGRAVTQWREILLAVLASLDVSLDFSDEGDVSAAVTDGLVETLTHLSAAVASQIAAAERGERLREGCTVVIAGPPNAGKSTLLNALARRDVAIVSDIPGTTRDALEVRCDLNGWPVTFVDTAGLRDSADPIERAGMERARAHAGRADLVLWLDAPGETGEPEAFGGVPIIRLRSKADLLSEAPEPDGPLVSALTGRGLPALLDHVQALAEAAMHGSEHSVATRERHRVALIDLLEALERAISRLREGHDELAAEDIRLGTRALGRIVGTVDVEDVLDRIFAQFCIGK